MSDGKRKFNPWVAISIMGLVTILFSMFAFQQQTELIDARKEIEQLQTKLADTQERVEDAERRLVITKQQLEQALIDAQIAREVAENASTKSSKRK